MPGWNHLGFAGTPRWESHAGHWSHAYPMRTLAQKKVKPHCPLGGPRPGLHGCEAHLSERAPTLCGEHSTWDGFEVFRMRLSFTSTALSHPVWENTQILTPLEISARGVEVSLNDRKPILRGKTQHLGRI